VRGHACRSPSCASRHAPCVHSSKTLVCATLAPGQMPGSSRLSAPRGPPAGGAVGEALPSGGRGPATVRPAARPACRGRGCAGSTQLARARHDARGASGGRACRRAGRRPAHARPPSVRSARRAANLWCGAWLPKGCAARCLLSPVESCMAPVCFQCTASVTGTQACGQVLGTSEALTCHDAPLFGNDLLWPGHGMRRIQPKSGFTALWTSRLQPSGRRGCEAAPAAARAQSGSSRRLGAWSGSCARPRQRRASCGRSARRPRCRPRRL